MVARVPPKDKVARSSRVMVGLFLPFYFCYCSSFGMYCFWYSKGVFEVDPLSEMGWISATKLYLQV